MAHPGTPRFSGGRVAVDSPDVASLTLLNPLPVWARCYVLPWLVLYPLAYHAFFNEYDQWIKSIGQSLPPPPRPPRPPISPTSAPASQRTKLT